MQRLLHLTITFLHLYGVSNVIDCPAIKSYPFKQSLDSQIFNAIALPLYH